jgi:hypothetical protein
MKTAQPQSSLGAVPVDSNGFDKGESQSEWASDSEPPLSEATTDPSGLRVESLPENWADVPPPPRPHIIASFYPRGKVSALLGAGTVGKSTLGAEQIVHVVTGIPWRGFEVLHGDVAVLSWEDETPDYAGKLYAAVRGNPELREHAEEIRRRIHFIPMHGSGRRLVDNFAGRAAITSLADDIVTRLRPFPELVWLVVETASRANGSDEMNEGMARLVEALEIVSHGLDIAVTVSHHVSKAADRSGETDATAGRGGSALADNCRATTVLALLDGNSTAAMFPPGYSAANLKGREIVLIENARSSYARRAPRIWVERRYLPEGLPYFSPLEQASSMDKDPHLAELAALDERLLTFLRIRMRNEWHSERAICRDWMPEHQISERTAQACLSRLTRDGKLLLEIQKQYGDKGKPTTRYRIADVE